MPYTLHALASQTKEWFAQMKGDGNTHRVSETLGAQHYAVLTKASPILLVTFETVEAIFDDGKNELPLGFELVAENGWSHLGIIANGNTWFRNKAVYDYFDRLDDEEFFENFDQVIFIGSGMCGYAAAAYSVVAPGCTVIAFNPQATLDTGMAEWDKRYQTKRRLSFDDRYGYAPDLIEAANRGFILYDPEEEMDAMHAALFTRPHVTKLRCRHLSGHIMQDMMHMGILLPLLQTASAGGDIAQRFYSLYRARRNYLPYLRRLLMRLDDDDRSFLSYQLCRHVVGRMDDKRFERRLISIEAKLLQKGYDVV